jgi:hypothetical protein
MSWKFDRSVAGVVSLDGSLSHPLGMAAVGLCAQQTNSCLEDAIKRGRSIVLYVNAVPLVYSAI